MQGFFIRNDAQGMEMKGVEARELSSNLFIFKFFHWKDKQKVLDNEPWNFYDSVLILK